MTSLVSFNDQVTCLVDEGKNVDVVYMDFSKAIDTDFLWRKWQRTLANVCLSPWLRQVTSYLG